VATAGDGSLDSMRDTHASDGESRSGSTTDPGWRLGRRPGLDGLRGVAILLVLAGHVLTFGTGRPSNAGNAGVSLFFALSGFLITSLIVERVDGGRMSLPRFYRDRGLRLIPALLFLLLVCQLLEVAGVSVLEVNQLPILLDYANWVAAGRGHLGAFNHTWSLSVEEQFYLVWPILLVWSMRWRRGPAVIATTGIVVSTVLRFALALGPGGLPRVYYGSDTQAAGLLIGCLLAWAAHRGLREVRPPGWMVTGGTLALFLWLFDGSSVNACILVPTVVPVIAFGLIWAACTMSGGWLTSPVLRYLGARSYGLYLWHYPAIYAVRIGIGQSLVGTLLAVAVAFVAAELSWRVIERPLVSLRHRVAAPGRAIPRIEVRATES
jgi:peptidoglycan/LPS O-acetylase OafA/YrhL